MRWSAVNPGAPKATTRRAAKPSYNPLYERAKMLADELWERAQRMAEALAPEIPADTEPLDEWDQWQILQATALSFSPGYWDDPDALEDLYRLKLQFTGRDDRELQALAKLAKAKREALPPPEMTPRNPKWAETIEKVVGSHGNS